MEDKKPRPMTPEEQMTLWHDAFDFMNEKAIAQNLQFNIFDLYSMLNAGMADLIQAELVPFIKDTVSKIADSSIPEKTVKAVQEHIAYMIDQGMKIKEDDVTAFELFYMVASMNYVTSQIMDSLIYDEVSEQTGKENINEE